MSLRKFSEYTDSEVKTEVGEIKIQSIEEPIKEEVLLAPKDTSKLQIEILEEKIIKFNAGHIKDILETIKTKYSDTDYYFRKKDNQLHIVKYNENLKMNINEFVNSLLKFYSTSTNTRQITEGIKVKGNQNFSIIENMNSRYTQRFVDDLTKLLSKKKENI